MSLVIDRDTRDWIRNPADERAAAAGMVFDGERGLWVCDWIESTCCIYEGDLAGELMELMFYQRDYIMRLFGWVMPSTERGEWIRRFRHAGLWTSKKNGKSPLCAAVNLFLLCGDGEKGNKVYQGAANGEQATIAQAHALNMVEQSPALAAECKIHGSTFEITHRPTRSRLLILAGDDSRGAKRKEGINGSVSFDEMHVVDSKMYSRVLRAGRSRKEPLVLSYSTAGNDTDSIGHQRWEYGRKVNSGEIEDLRFLHVEHAAPPGTTEAEIDADFEKYAAMANPALGHLVKLSDLRDDWNRAKHSSVQLADELQYTFGIWVGAADRWLNQSGWAKGGREYTIAELAGRECYGGLDLSRTRDMTAAPLVFPWPENGPEAIRIWPMFWLPEERAKQIEHLVPEIKTWVKNKWLTLTPGATVDYNFIKDDYRKTIKTHNLIVMSLHYDRHMANEITQALHEGETIDEHSIAGVVAQRVEFEQANSFYGPLCSEFERRVIAGLVQHPNNGVMNWQVSHCQAKADANGMIRPVKPKRDGVKTIDGVQGVVMATAGLPAQKGTVWPASYFNWDGFWFDDWPDVRKGQKTARIQVLTRGKKEYQAHVQALAFDDERIYLDAAIEREDNVRMVTRAVDMGRAFEPLDSIAIEDIEFWAELVPTILAVSDKVKLRQPWECLHGTAGDHEERVRKVTWLLANHKVHVRSTRGGRELVRQWMAWPSERDEAAEAVGTLIKRLEMG